MGHTFGSLVADGPLIVAAGVAALVGLISFASPCVLPLVPGYLSYVTGLVGAGARRQVAVPAGGGGVGPAAGGRASAVGAGAVTVTGSTPPARCSPATTAATASSRSTRR